MAAFGSHIERIDRYGSLPATIKKLETERDAYREALREIAVNYPCFIATSKEEMGWEHQMIAADVLEKFE